MRPLLLIFSLALLPLFAFAQDRDSIYRAYHDAVQQRDNAKTLAMAEKLGMYYETDGDDDSSAFYFTIAGKYATTKMKQAECDYHVARALMYTDPTRSLQISRRGYELVKDSMSNPRMRLCNLMGVYYSLHGQYDSSLVCYTNALQTAQQIKDSVWVLRLKGNIGDLYSYKGEFATALKYQLELLGIYEQHNDSANIMISLVNVGNTYSYMSESKKAMQYYNRIYPLLKDKKTRLAGNLFNSMAVCYEDMQQLGKAQEFLLKSLEVKKALKDSVGIANTYYNLGIVADSTGDEAAAIRYLTDANVIGRKINDRRIVRVNDQLLGDIFKRRGEYAKALSFYLESATLAEEDEDFDSRHQAYKRLYQTYELTGDYKNAFVFFQKYKIADDSINNLENVRKQAEAEAKYLQQKNEREKTQLVLTNRVSSIEKEQALLEKRRAIALSAGGVALLALIFFLVYRNVRIRAKAKEELLVIESEQRERTRISRDLHDNVGTQLSLISNNIEWITHPLKQLSEEEKNSKLEFVGATAKEVISTLRETIWALNKETITFEEFSDKLKSHVQKQAQLVPSIRTGFSEALGEELQLGPSEALGLFRICQEAVANALKHSGASLLSIRFLAKDGHYEVRISDDGKGFSGENGVAEHYGLENMKQRAAEIGCSLVLTSAPGQGTQVDILHK